MKTKICSKCKKRKKPSKFTLDKRTPSGLGSWCKECKNKNRRDFTKSNPEHAKKQWTKYNLKSKYGLAIEDYDKMFVEQNGLCAICGRIETATNQYGLTKLSVEHRHSDGRVRGLVCRTCNHLIDIYETDFYGLKEKIIKYMEKQND